MKYLLFTFAIIISLIQSNFTLAQCPTVVPNGIDSCRLSPGSVQIGAAGSTGFYSWYDAAVGGNFLGTGTPFNTPYISTTTTYYVAAADTNIALDFDGTNDFVALGNPAQLQITGDMTIEMWVKPDVFGARRNPYAKAYGGEGTITQEINGTLNYYYGTNGGNGTPYQGFNSGSVLNLGQWNHIAIVRDLTNMQLRWYINGVLTRQGVASYAAATAGSNNVTIGQGYVSRYDGQIDELRVWSSARTTAQIVSHMDSCLVGNEANLAAYYNFSDGSGTTLTDLTASANHGTLTNMAPASNWVTASYNFHCPSCESGRTPVVATINGSTPLNLGNDTNFYCGVNSITLNAGASYTNYLWSTGATTSSISVSTGGTYWVQVDNGSGCYDFDTILISDASGPLNTLDFDGTNQHALIGNPSQLQITGNMTIEMWLKPDNFSSRKNPYAKAYGGEGTITQEPSGRLSYYYGISGGNASPYQGFSSNSSLNVGEWNHIAIVRDLDNMRLHWYINGVLTNSANASYTAAVASANNVLIAQGYVNNYDGQIDELRIWNRPRTQTEIRTNMCKKLLGAETGLVAYYRFDEGAGSTLTDLTKNGLDGTINNAPSWVVSAAAIGDDSDFLYPANWTAQSLTHSFCGGESLTVSNMTGTPNGVHIYSVGTVPTNITGIVGLGSNDRYFGVFKVNDAAATYTATYNYNGNPYVGPGNEDSLQLYRRADNATIPWVNTGATLNKPATTLTATAQSTEFILGSNNFPLPVKLISFNAIVNDKYVDLMWITLTEINNDYFTIERSKNGINWEEIETVTGAGNSSTRLEYFKSDYEPYSGVSYYRLKQTDFDGAYTYSNIVTVNIYSADITDINVYPNPVKAGSNLTIDLINYTQASIEVELLDVTGRVVLNEKYNNNQIISLEISSQLEAGIYSLRIGNQIQKLIIK